MTDRAKGFIVHLDDDYRLGDGDSGADRILDAIRCIKGVVKVEPMLHSGGDVLNRERVRLDLQRRILDALQ